MQIVIEIPEGAYDACNELMTEGDNTGILGPDLINAVGKGAILPEHHGRLIDADKTLTIAWQKFWKQEEEHEKTIEGYDILRDRFYEQEGFECCQQTIVNAETIIPATKEEKKCTDCKRNVPSVFTKCCRNSSEWRGRNDERRSGNYYREYTH